MNMMQTDLAMNHLNRNFKVGALLTSALVFSFLFLGAFAIAEELPAAQIEDNRLLVNPEDPITLRIPKPLGKTPKKTSRQGPFEPSYFWIYAGPQLHNLSFSQSSSFQSSLNFADLNCCGAGFRLGYFGNGWGGEASFSYIQWSMKTIAEGQEYRFTYANPDLALDVFRQLFLKLGSLVLRSQIRLGVTLQEAQLLLLTQQAVRLARLKSTGVRIGAGWSTYSPSPNQFSLQVFWNQPITYSSVDAGLEARSKYNLEINFGTQHSLGEEWSIGALLSTRFSKFSYKYIDPSGSTDQGTVTTRNDSLELRAGLQF